MKTSKATVLVVWADASLSLLQSGVQVWHRPEFLGCISQLVYLDRVAVTAASADADIVTPIDMSLPGRLALQVHDLIDSATGLVSWIAQLPLTLSRLLAPSAVSVATVRGSLNPEYGFEKILVALSPLSDSSVSVISAVDSMSGSLLWSVPVTVTGAAAAPVLYVTRARPFESHPPEVSVVWSIPASSYNTSVSIGNRVLYAGVSASTFVLRISALTGHVLNSRSFNIQAAQVFMLDRLLDSTHCSMLFALDAQHNLVQALFDVSPSLHDKLASAFVSTVLHTAAKLGHSVSGFKLLTTSASDLFRVSPVWSTVLPASQQVVEIVHGDSCAYCLSVGLRACVVVMLTCAMCPQLLLWPLPPSCSAMILC